MPASPTSADILRFERVLRNVVLSNGVARRTARGRFIQLDLQIEACLREVFPVGARLRVEDWAASSGITAAEWFSTLRGDYPDLQFTASDRTLYLIEIRQPSHRGIYIVEPDGTPVQYILPPFVVSLVQNQHWAFPVNRMLREKALRQWKQSVAKQFVRPWQWRGLDDGLETVSVSPLTLRQLPLVHPEVMKLRSSQFHFAEHSVFESLAKPADVIRTMNILSRAYFPESKIRDAAVSIAASLKPGGIWIIGRTIVEQPPQHEATVFQKRDIGWNVLLRCGAGSEIEPIIACPPQSSDFCPMLK